MKTKPILCPGRLRHVPRQFSWIDQRLVRDRHIQDRSPEALALDLFLCTVADAQGASYYSDSTAGKLISLSSARLCSEEGLHRRLQHCETIRPFCQAAAPHRLPQPRLRPRRGSPGRLG